MRITPQPSHIYSQHPKPQNTSSTDSWRRRLQERYVPVDRGDIKSLSSLNAISSYRLFVYLRISGCSSKNSPNPNTTKVTMEVTNPSKSNQKKVNESTLIITIYSYLKGPEQPVLDSITRKASKLPPQILPLINNRSV